METGFETEQLSSPSPRVADDPLAIVGWLWRRPEGSNVYIPERANIWARMFHRRLTIPHRFVLVTDQLDADYDPLIEPVPLWDDWRDLVNPYWGDKVHCYVRLKAFSREMRAIFGPRFVSTDLDCVVNPNADLDPLFDRKEDFVILHRNPVNEKERVSTYQGSMWMMDTGAREQVWTEFQGISSVSAASRYMGTDQAWIRHKLGPDEAGWTEADGVYCFRSIEHDVRYYDAPPENARIIFFNTHRKPWDFGPINRLFGRCYKCGYQLDRGAVVKCTNCQARNRNRRAHEWVADFYQ